MRGHRQRAEFEAAPPLPDEWRETVLPGGARFLTDRRTDDFGLGDPDGGRRGRPVSQILRSLIRAVPPMAVVFASITFASFAAEMSAWLWDPSVLLQVDMLPYDVATLSSLTVALLAAAVLIWRRDAWRSARLVLLGAVVWTLAPMATYLVFRLVFHFAPDIVPPLSMPIAYTQLSVQLVSLGGPLLIAIGLQRCRTSGARTKWPRPLVVIALLAASAVAYDSVTSSLTNEGVGWDPGLSWLTEAHLAVWPFSIACILAIAWLSLSAVRAGDTPRRFWQLISAGSTAIAISSILGWIFTYVSYRLLVIPPDLNAISIVSVSLGLCGSVSLLAAFVMPMLEGSQTPAEPEPGFDPEIEPEVEPA